MGAGEQLETTAGPRQGASPLAHLDRRRSELWVVSVLLLATVAGALALLVLRGELVVEWFGISAPQAWVAGVLLAGVGVSFGFYVVEKEASLRRLADQLVAERIHSAGLSARLEELARLSEVGRAVNGTLQLPEVLARILCSALELLDCGEGTILLLSPDDSSLTVAGHSGPKDRPLPERVGLDEGYPAQVVRSREPLLVADAKDAGLSHLERPLPPEGVSYMCVPLIHSGTLLGVLELLSGPERSPFTEDELGGLRFFGEHAAVAISNARLFEQERETVKRLQELDSMKDDFVAMVSHELRSPLSAIIGAAKTLGRAEIEMGAEQRADFLEMIYRQADKMLHLAEDFLTAARMEEGTTPKLRREQIDLQSVAEQVVGDLKLSALGRGRRLAVTAVPSHPQVWGDPQGVRQVLSNLVENALKYSSQDDSVRVRVRELPTEAVLEVCDEGKGIPEDQVETIFERYRQVQENGTRSIQGVGLGLFITKRLVEAHRGSIEVESREGQGSTFRVRLPVRSRN